MWPRAAVIRTCGEVLPGVKEVTLLFDYCVLCLVEVF